MTYDHRTSIIAYIDKLAARNRAKQKLGTASELDALSSSIKAYIDIEAGTQGVATAMDAIFTLVAETYHLTVEEIKQTDNVRLRVRARDTVLWLFKTKLDMKVADIATEVGCSKEVVYAALTRVDGHRIDEPSYLELTNNMLKQTLVCEHCQNPLTGVLK